MLIKLCYQLGFFKKNGKELDNIEESILKLYKNIGISNLTYILEDTNFTQEGSVVVGIMEGTRPILVEIQALVSQTNAPMPRRTAIGIDYQRLSLILAVLEKMLRISYLENLVKLKKFMRIEEQ